MPKRGETKPRPSLGDTTDPHGLPSLVSRYLYHLKVRNYSPRTVENREHYLRFFIEWAAAEGVTKAGEVTKAFLEAYQEHVYELRKRDGARLSAASQVSRLVPIRAFFSWACRKDHLIANPAADLEMPKVGRHLPKNLMSPADVRKVFTQPDLTRRNGVRDRAILEVLYSTGIRRMELCRLKLHSIDADRGVIFVYKGKGSKDRYVPIGDRAIHWVHLYVDEYRPTPADGHEDTLFLTMQGRSLTENRLTMLVREHIRAAGLGKSGSCHLFRHSMATGMLDGGADIRHIQAQLGHADLSTTQIYTHVAIGKLKEVHAKTHPINHIDDADDTIPADHDVRH